jgi:deazaflavin-dependent oxidoreductase (nitroreductase family)
MTKFGELDFIQKHIALYRRDPAKAHMWDSSPGGGPGVLPTLLLTTTGRKSGEPRDVPLIYGTTGTGDGATGEAYVVVASRGGTPTHPVWFLNLAAEPACELQVSTLHLRARARVAEGAERERLWKRMAEIYPPYDDYQVRAGARTIPVVVLEPV